MLTCPKCHKELDTEELHPNRTDVIEHYAAYGEWHDVVLRHQACNSSRFHALIHSDQFQE